MPATLYDVFISHAYEDKSPFANWLAVELKKRGLKVWYSGFELKAGDSLAATVHAALRCARYGVVIISPVYTEKQEVMIELHALLSQEAENNRILPVLHAVPVQQVQQQLPMLTVRHTLSSQKSMTVIVNRILQVVNRKRKYTRKKNAKSPAAKKKRASKSNAAAIAKKGFITLGGGAPALPEKPHGL